LTVRLRRRECVAVHEQRVARELQILVYARVEKNQNCDIGKAALCRRIRASAAGVPGRGEGEVEVCLPYLYTMARAASPSNGCDYTVTGHSPNALFLNHTARFCADYDVS
jgi:hypothetical protein